MKFQHVTLLVVAPPTALHIYWVNTSISKDSWPLNLIKFY